MRRREEGQGLGLQGQGRQGPGGTCGTKPCWKALTTKGWGYTNRDGNTDDTTKVALTGGVQFKAVSP